MYYVVILFIIFVFAIVILGVKIVPQSQTYVIERFGGYNADWEVGFHFLIPFIDRIAKKVSLKESLFDYEPQSVITKDNVTLSVDTVVFYQIADAKLYTYGAENPKLAIEKLTLTTLRNVIGELELDETLTSRDTINGRLRSILDDATDAWGIKVNRVEVKNIEPPASVREAMEKQMRAEREKRAMVLEAEGQKEAAILKAEGQKQSVILAAEAKKEAAIREAEGEAAAIISVQKSVADGLAMIKETVGAEGAIKLKSFEALEKVADGKSTKIIIPSDLQNLSSLVCGLTEIAK
ncbi:MAG: SPFH/Band 7/PHB domain protein [Spirochaetaceae bacterium]|jgi:regulator of protease activity HflC (stomatin/prohibitin superfamily)|nr:SPFH/Band 7/PHB domain protein [Spirochaetaceae bacterium]